MKVSLIIGSLECKHYKYILQKVRSLTPEVMESLECKVYKNKLERFDILLFPYCTPCSKLQSAGGVLYLFLTVLYYLFDPYTV